MRKHLGKLITQSITTDDRIWLLTGDLGFGVLDDARKICPERAINMGASEQLMIGAAIGLANEGKIPLCYSITPFLIFRPYEFIRNYVDHEKTPIKLIGIGRDFDYLDQGFSHWANDDIKAMSVFENVKQYRPNDENDLIELWDYFLYNNLPCYLNIKRT